MKFEIDNIEEKDVLIRRVVIHEYATVVRFRPPGEEHDEYAVYLEGRKILRLSNYEAGALATTLSEADEYMEDPPKKEDETDE
jgi:hypothetical protein